MGLEGPDGSVVDLSVGRVSVGGVPVVSGGRGSSPEPAPAPGAVLGYRPDPPVGKVNDPPVGEGNEPPPELPVAGGPVSLLSIVAGVVRVVRVVRVIRIVAKASTASASVHNPVSSSVGSAWATPPRSAMSRMRAVMGPH